jgi:hypothetical protein
MYRSSPPITLFSEEQRFRHPLLQILISILVAMSWLLFIYQVIYKKPFGSNSAPNAVVWTIWLVFGIAFPLFFLVLRMTTEVLEDAVVVRFIPGNRRLIRLEAIQSFAAREYRPMREYGGWGIQHSRKHGTAYSVSGNRGVQLVLNNGKRILIGSQEADRLADALRAALRRHA